MAWALQFDGNDYLTLQSLVTVSGDFELTLEFKLDSVSENQYVVGYSSSTSNYVGYVNGAGFVFKLNNNALILPNNPTADTWYTLTVTRVGALVTASEPIMGEVSANEAGSFLFDRFGRLANFSGSGAHLVGQFKRLEITGGASHYWDAATSNHTTGQPVLTDTVGTNDAQGFNFPTDGSAWVDLGGGATSIDATATETFNPFTDSSSLNIDANVSLSATEVLSSFQDSANTDISYNISVTATETLSSFEDASIASVVTQGEISSSVTEVFSSFQDSSAISLSANVGTQVTEVLQSFVDSSIINLAKEIDVSAGEVLAPFVDESTVKLPSNWVVKTKAETSYTIKSNTTTNWTTRG